MLAKNKRGIGLVMVCINILLIGFLVVFFYTYNTHYQGNMKEKNLSNIQNLNQSSASLAEKFFENQQKELSNLAQYITKREFTETEILEYICDWNADDTSSYEIIEEDYTGYVGRKKDDFYYEVDYSSKDYKDFQKVFRTVGEDALGEVSFVPEFTDAYNGIKSFGLYAVVPVKQEDGTMKYGILLSVSKSKAFSEMIQMNGGYDGISSVMFDEKGNYIVSTDSFKSDNFFQFIYLYNHLTLDEKKDLRDVVTASQEGELFYKNGTNEDCVYVYSKMNNGNWYIVTGVSLNKFQEDQIDYRLTLVSVTILLMLFCVDMLWMRSMNHRLKESMYHEKRANSAKSDFLARMSHDIRTPLNAVIGFSNLASAEPNLSDTVKDSLLKINSSGRYLLGLINDILDMSKIESNKLEFHESLVNGPQFLREIEEVFASQAEQKGIRLVTDFSECRKQWIYMDSLRSRQIYSNLLNNAIKFSAAGTIIRWSIKEREISEKEVEIVCVISDQGCGMSKEFMQHIFKPFEQEVNAHSDIEGGTGLGLSIVKSLVDIMGGTIAVESELGKGTTFTITMKRRFEEHKEMSEQDEKDKINLKSLENKRVLLCEDHPLNQEIAIRLLKKQKVEVESAGNGEEGLRKFEESKVGYFDAILMDVRMPVMNGLEATKAIRMLEREDAKTIPIIAMTANAFDEDVQNCLKAGMNAHMAKPFEKETLYEILCRHIK